MMIIITHANINNNMFNKHNMCNMNANNNNNNNYISNHMKANITNNNKNDHTQRQQ